MQSCRETVLQTFHLQSHFLQTKRFCPSHLPDEKASQAGNPSSDNVLDPILELKQRRIVREKKCSTFIDINSCLQRFETASMQCRMLKVNEIQLGFASRIPVVMLNNVYLYICGFVTDVFPLFFDVKLPFFCALHCTMRLSQCKWVSQKFQSEYPHCPHFFPIYYRENVWGAIWPQFYFLKYICGTS